MKKRIIFFILGAAITLSGCSSGGNPLGNNDTNSQIIETEQTDETEPTDIEITYEFDHKEETEQVFKTEFDEEAEEKIEPESEPSLSDYIIVSGTYANGDKLFDDIPFIKYKISVPSDWTAKKIEYDSKCHLGSFYYITPVTDEIYYLFQKNSVKHLIAGESYLKEYYYVSVEDRIMWGWDYVEDSIVELDDYDVKLTVSEEASDGYRYVFQIPIDKSDCIIIGLSQEYSQEQKDEFINIIKTFEIVE